MAGWIECQRRVRSETRAPTILAVRVLDLSCHHLQELLEVNCAVAYRTTTRRKTKSNYISNVTMWYVHGIAVSITVTVFVDLVDHVLEFDLRRILTERAHHRAELVGCDRSVAVAIKHEKGLAKLADLLLAENDLRVLFCFFLHMLMLLVEFNTVVCGSCPLYDRASFDLYFIGHVFHLWNYDFRTYFLITKKYGWHLTKSTNFNCLINNDLISVCCFFPKIC